MATKTTFIKEHSVFIMCAFVMTAGFLTLWLCPTLNQADRNHIYTMQIMVLGFYVGNSKGNTKKDEIIVDQLVKSENKE